LWRFDKVGGILMANYMAEVAKMFCVELGEEFKCDNGFTYMFTEKGIVSPSLVYMGFYAKPDLEEEHYEKVLISLLNGGLTIVHKPYKPKVHESYYFISPRGTVSMSLNQSDDTLCPTLYKLGNCYSTRQEAEANFEKWMAFYQSDEVLEV
jgi:hypothetical protein